MSFKVGDISHKKWIEINTKYPTINLILEKLYKYTGYLDEKTINEAIDIYTYLLSINISPQNAIRRWDVYQKKYKCSDIHSNFLKFCTFRIEQTIKIL